MNEIFGATCEARVNGEYLKIASESVIIKGNEYILFDFTVPYPDDNNRNVFTVKMEFKKDKNETRVYYNLDEDDDSIIVITVYNAVHKDVLFSDMHKILNIAGIDFYIRHKIYSNFLGYKDVTMELYVK